VNPQTGNPFNSAAAPRRNPFAPPPPPEPEPAHARDDGDSQRSGSRGGAESGEVASLRERVATLEGEVERLRSANERFAEYMDKAEAKIAALARQLREAEARRSEEPKAPPPAKSPPVREQPSSPPLQQQQQAAKSGASAAKATPAAAKATPAAAAAAPSPPIRAPPARKPVPEPEEEEEEEEEQGDALGARREEGANGGSLEDQPVGGGSGGSVPPADAGPVQTFPCNFCGKRFRKEALTRHLKLKICQKKREPMDMTAARLGIEDERAVEKLKKAAEAGEDKLAAAKAKAKAKREQDRAQLRAAIEAGRAISQAQRDGVDPRTIALPAAPSAPDTRVECPHCGRKFAEETAERHIPKCKDMQHNKRRK
jgi:uncharacterized Zn-finger protein